MPLNATYQFWYEHHLYVLADGLPGGPPTGIVGLARFTPSDDDVLTSLNSITSLTTSANVPNMYLFDKIRSLSLSSNPTTAEITTRDEARDGFRTEVDLPAGYSMTFPIRYQSATQDSLTSPTAAVLTNHQAVIRGFLRASLAGTPVGAIDVDKAASSVTPPAFDGTPGSLGLAGNWSVSFNITKEVDNVVYAEMTLRLAEFPKMVVFDTAGGSWAKL